MKTLSRNNLGVSLSACSDLPPDKTVDLLHDFGVRVVELNQKYLDNFPSGPEVLAQAGLHLTAHVPHDHKNFHPLSRDLEAGKRSVDNIMQWITRVHAQGVDYFTVHLMDPAPARLDEFWDNAVTVAKTIGDFAKETGVRIGFENCYRMVRDGPIAARFFDAVDRPSLGLTLDAGHFWSALDLDEFGNLKETKAFLKQPEGVVEMNRMLHEMVDCLQHRILHFHVHDIDRESWEDHHWVGSGVMDYPSLLEQLCAMDYQGTMVVEIHPVRGEGFAGLRKSLGYLLGTGKFG